jgi:hypothetical protein
MLVFDKLTVHAITRELIDNHVEYMGDSKWTPHIVDSILTQPKYAGYHVFGRTSCKLCTPTVRLPKSKWILTPGAFAPIVDRATFVSAQQILQSRTIHQSNEELLNRLRALLAFAGRLSPRLIEESDDIPSPSTFVHRFGGLRRAYELIGYDRNFKFIDLRGRIQLLREELLMRIRGMFPDRVSIVRPGLKWRSRLRLSNGLIVSVLIARSVRPWRTARWRILPVLHECGFVTLLARLDDSNRSFLDYHVFPDVGRRTRFDISVNDSWLNRGKPLFDLLTFCEAVCRVDATRRNT